MAGEYTDFYNPQAIQFDLNDIPSWIYDPGNSPVMNARSQGIMDRARIAETQAREYQVASQQREDQRKDALRERIASEYAGKTATLTGVANAAVRAALEMGDVPTAYEILTQQKEQEAAEMGKVIETKKGLINVYPDNGRISARSIYSFPKEDTSPRLVKEMVGPNGDTTYSTTVEEFKELRSLGYKPLDKDSLAYQLSQLAEWQKHLANQNKENKDGKAPGRNVTAVPNTNPDSPVPSKTPSPSKVNWRGR